LIALRLLYVSEGKLRPAKKFLNKNLEKCDFIPSYLQTQSAFALEAGDFKPSDSELYQSFPRSPFTLMPNEGSLTGI
jgi:hypothetical protein